MINILIADDHKMIIDGIKALLAGAEDIRVIGQAMTGREVTDFVKSNAHNLDLIVLDINMPDGDGIDVTKYIRKNFPRIKVLILSMYNKPVFIKNLVEAGVSGYMLKNTGKEELIEAITKIHSGMDYFSPEVTKSLMDSLRNPVNNPAMDLTKRELEILKLLAKALTTAEIAELLFLSTYTIDTHRKNLLSKLNLKNTPALVKYAIENGLAENKF